MSAIVDSALFQNTRQSVRFPVFIEFHDQRTFLDLSAFHCSIVGTDYFLSICQQDRTIFINLITVEQIVDAADLIAAFLLHKLPVAKNDTRHIFPGNSHIIIAPVAGLLHIDQYFLFFNVSFIFASCKTSFQNS